MTKRKYALDKAELLESCLHRIALKDVAEHGETGRKYVMELCDAADALLHVLEFAGLYEDYSKYLAEKYPE